VELQVAGVATKAPSAANELLRRCVAGATGSDVRQIQWIVDATKLIEDGAIDWAQLASDARRERLTLPLVDALNYLSTLVPFDIPEGFRSELGETPTTPRERVAHRLERYGGTVLGSFPGTVAQYVRVTADEPAGAAITRAPGFLKQAWGAESATEVPLMAARAVRERLGARRARI
jgi:hypothetical protein